MSKNPKNQEFTKTQKLKLQPDPVTGSRVPAIHQNTGFVFRDSDDAAAKFNLAGENSLDGHLFATFVHMHKRNLK